MTYEPQMLRVIRYNGDVWNQRLDDVRCEGCERSKNETTMTNMVTKTTDDDDDDVHTCFNRCHPPANTYDHHPVVGIPIRRQHIRQTTLLDQMAAGAVCIN